ncbi:ci repressor-like protein [Rodentibacter caecimuris]|uniref:DNA-binding protein n=1 Tax=Rodentibacter caecimuris TaxID=1796644 RepID=UPI0010943B0E|nr:DNA-binding protein [Pasteurella caecimuris]TGY49700.1 ci repressor-like protein [Pasteurella caecimuris]
MNSFSKTEWFTAYELEGLVDLPKKATNITRKATKENWLRRQIRGKKGVAFEYHYSSLPLLTQKALGFLDLSKKDSSELHNEKLQQRVSQLESKLQALENNAQNLLPPKLTDSLSDNEWRLVYAFRRCNDDRKIIAMSAIEALAIQTENEQKESSEPFTDCKIA